jgi:inner membrane protein
MTSVFAHRLQNQNIEYQSISTYPTLLNNFLWRCIADAGDDYYVGYYSLFDANQNVQFKKIPKNHQLLTEFQQHSKIRKLTFFSKNKYALRRENRAIIYNDMRYGPASVRGDNTDSVFSYRLERASKDQPELKVTRAHSRTVNQAEFTYFIERIFGKNQGENIVE